MTSWDDTGLGIRNEPPLPDTHILTSLPLFPLGTVLFPGGVLSLRIFEVRYLDMMTKCHKAGAPFGVVALTQGTEVRRPGAPPDVFHDIGTLATIAAFETPQPGLITVRCHGEQRFRISHREQLPRGLWVADVQRMDDDLAVPVPEDLQSVARALGTVLTSLTARQDAGVHPATEQPWRLTDCGWVANRWCELLPVPPELKQRLMQLDNPLVRLELVSDVLTRTGIAR